MEEVAKRFHSQRTSSISHLLTPRQGLLSTGRYEEVLKTQAGRRAEGPNEGWVGV